MVEYTNQDLTTIIKTFEGLGLNNLVRVLKHVEFNSDEFYLYLLNISNVIVEDCTSSIKPEKIMVRKQPVQVSTKTSIDFHKKLKNIMFDLSLEQLPKELGTVEKELLPIIHWRLEIEK